MVIDIKHTTIRIKDGSGQHIDVKIGNGNFTYNEKRNMDYIKDRGLLDTVREGDEEPLDVRLDFQWIHITGGTSGGSTVSVEDAIKNQGAAATWVSASSDLCEPYCVDIEIRDLPPCGTDTPETVLLPDFRWESLGHDLRASTVALSGKCNSKLALPTRGALSS